MKTGNVKFLVAAGIIAALPTLAVGHDGPHSGVTVAGLNYEEIYREKLKGGTEVTSKATTLDGNMKFATCPAGTPCGSSELAADTPWAIYANGTQLGTGTLGEDPKAKFSAKKGKATINLANGKLKLTWDKRFINFYLKWSGDALLAKSYIDKAEKKINVPGGAQIDVLVGETRALFDTPAKGSSKVAKKGSTLLSDIVLAGKAKSAGDPSAVDRDGDGYTNDVEASVDASCDYDATRNPGATEARLDGVDSDCDTDRADRGELGRDSEVPEALDTYQGNTTAFSSPTVAFDDGTGTPLRDFSAWNKTFKFSVIGKVSFYDPTTGNSYNDYNMTPEADGKGIWRAWTHTGKWAFFNAKAGDVINLTLEKDAAATAPGTHPAFIIFWRPEGAPLPWAGTQDIGSDGKMSPTVDIVPAHNVPQKADWTITGLPEKTDHAMPSGVDPNLYPAPSNEYTLYHVAAGWDNDLYTPTNKFVMHPTALNGLAVSDGVPGKLVKSVTLPKDGYYLLQVTNVLEAEDWAVCASGDTNPLCAGSGDSGTSPGAGHGGTTAGLGLKNDLNPNTSPSKNDINVTITPGAHVLRVQPGALGDNGAGIHYDYIIDQLQSGYSVSINGHDDEHPDVMGLNLKWGVGQQSWCQNGACTGVGNATSIGWNHTSMHVGFDLTQKANVTIALSNATQPAGSAAVDEGGQPLGSDLKPGFSLYSGKGTTGANPLNHTFQNQTNISWSNTTAIIGWKDAGDANNVSETYLLEPGFYTLYVGGNIKNVANPSGGHAKDFQLTITTAAP